MSVRSAVFTLLSSLFFAVMGVYALARPAGVLARFGVSVETPAGRTEVRAVYGGFGLAVAVSLLDALVRPRPASAGVFSAVAFATLGMALGRVVSRPREGRLRFYPTWFYFWVEVALAAALLSVALAPSRP